MIDVGTNSVLALGMDENNTILFNDYKISELGKGMVTNDMFLHDENIRRAFIIISKFIGQLHALKITDIHIIGTSASRDARNITSLEMLLFNKYQIRYKILSGDEEARFTYLGALTGFQNKNRYFLMMDIGGGSTEIIYGKKNMIIYKHSFNIGAVRLFDQLKCHYRFSKEDFKRTIAHVLDKFTNLPHIDKSTTFVGIGGTFTTASAIKNQLSTYSMEKINNTTLHLDELSEMMNMINQADEIERRNIVGLEIKRAPYIIYGMLIYITFMKRLGLKTVRPTDYGLRFGYAKYILEKS